MMENKSNIDKYACFLSHTRDRLVKQKSHTCDPSLMYTRRLHKMWYQITP